MIKKAMRVVFLGVLALLALGVFTSGRALASESRADDAPYTVRLPFVVTGTAGTAGETTITLNGDSIAVSGSGVTVEGTVATITAAGHYIVSGTLNDGQLLVDTEDEEMVQLTLIGVDITSATSAPLAILSAEETIITLAEGSDNTLTDAATYVFPDAETDEPNAALFSNDDLTIGGGGSLTVVGNYNDAISTDDSLTISGGVITVSAVDDGLRGKDALVISGGDITVEAGGDGLKSDNEDDTTLGTIAISGGVFDITAAGDGIAAKTTVTISGGDFALLTGGGSGATLADDVSAKGIKGLVSVTIEGGTFNVNAADDAVHSNNAITISGGALTLATGDDAIHADAAITIDDGTIDITESVEGIESILITINGGAIHIVASDDGINVAGDVAGAYHLYLHGGRIVIDAGGDGIDANGSITMTDGVVLVHGPTNQGNGAIDYDGTFNVSGGLLVAAGSAGMAQAPSATSTQNSVLIRFNGAQAAGALVHIQNSAGEDVLTFAPAKGYQSLVFSSAELVLGSAYTVYLGGSSTGTVSDGLYSGGSYTPGMVYANFTVNSSVTVVGGGGPPGP